MKWLKRLRRAAQMPPGVVAARLRDGARARVDRVLAPRLAARLDASTLCKALGAPTLDVLWECLANRPYAADTSFRSPDWEGRSYVDARASEAALRRVDLLGSGPVQLSTPIDWHTDFKSGRRWPVGYAHDIAYSELDQPTDVKVPWELSRMQWLVPIGQRYLLDRDEDDALFVRTILEEWIDGNPYAFGVNWACTMDVALRLITWTWLFHVFASSSSWSDQRFRGRFLTSLFLHGRFTERNLELSDVNGNHFTADAAGLVFAGNFFGEGRAAEQWSAKGWRLLQAELPRQVTSDGVDFEGSTAYHRLVTELFLLPALYRLRLGLSVPNDYRNRLLLMADFAADYNRGDAGAPVWGDADDARVLPFGRQPIGDHGYLPGIVGLAFGDPARAAAHTGQVDEAYWLCGNGPATSLGAAERVQRGPASYPRGGFYVLRGTSDHIFVDCGPVGLAGRGGHGHNDCLSFEAALDGTPLFVDCGSYVYTASAEWRNRFRSTRSHNTPIVDDAEQNRFVAPDNLWNLHYDALPTVLRWDADPAQPVFQGAHAGYRRLPDPVEPRRTIVLDPGLHRMAVRDTFIARLPHDYVIPFHLAPGFEVAIAPGTSEATLSDGTVHFALRWAGGWSVSTCPAWISQSYGRKRESVCIEFSRSGMPEPLVVAAGPVEQRDTLLAWAVEAVTGSAAGEL